ncbi:hypothetical protein [Paenibacillus caui]|uniref:hypothetical protein n=1 Tax=Paenibacillus caui TaxID=2873927 RepID=UPI00307FD3B7
MSSIWQISDWDLTLRLLLAAVCGGLIGLEREWSNHAAGSSLCCLFDGGQCYDY